MKNEVNITTSSTEMMTISRAEYESLKAERDELNQKLDWLMEQVRLAKKKVYGTSSEQTKEELVGQLSFMFDETEAWLSTRRTATEIENPNLFSIGEGLGFFGLLVLGSCRNLRLRQGFQFFEP